MAVNYTHVKVLCTEHLAPTYECTRGALYPIIRIEAADHVTSRAVVFMDDVGDEVTCFTDIPSPGNNRINVQLVEVHA